MRYILLLSVFLIPFKAGASLCDVAYASGDIIQNISVYEQCALSENNDRVLAKLAQIYSNGMQNISPNIQKALLFYQLSAENGNARSQLALAKMLMKMDERPSTREQLKTHLEKITFFMKQEQSGFQGEFLHPMVLMLLASEPAENKWYYMSDELSAPEAGGLLKNYKMTQEQRHQMHRLGGEWKRRKMFEAAKEIYSQSEFEKFEQAVYPKIGRADAFARKQAVEKLKQDIKKYKEK